MRLSLFGVLLAIVCQIALAQAPECSSPVLPVTIVGLPADRAGSLTPGNFRLGVNGNLQQVQSLTFGAFPRSTYILLDSSGSMTTSRYWSLASEFAIAAAKFAPSGDAKIAVFNERLSPFIDRKEAGSSGTSAIQALLDSGFKNGRTALYDAVLATLGAMPHVAPEDTILVITDAEDNASKADYKRVLAQLQSTHTRLIVVYVRHAGPAATMQEFQGSGDILEVTIKSGGMLYRGLPSAPLSVLTRQREAPPPASKEHDQYLAELIGWYRSVQNGYRIALPAISERTKIKLELVPKVEKVGVYYPHEITACATSSAAATR